MNLFSLKPWFRRCFFTFLLAGSACGSLSAKGQSDEISEAKRFALVIGNGAYASRLANPVRDARAMSETLRQLGFNVMERRDLGRDAMLRALIEFEDLISGQDALAVFFYAGHAMQLDGESVLLPVDTEVSGPKDARVTAVMLDRVVRSMSRAKPRAAIIMLDACRDNLFAPATPGGRRGLAGLLGAAPTNLMVQYATAPGQTAADDDPGSKNSPFTASLIEHLPTPGIDIHEVFQRVRRDVEIRTERLGQKQQPWETASLTAPVVLNPGGLFNGAGMRGHVTGERSFPAAQPVAGVPKPQTGTAADRLLIKLLSQTTSGAQRVRKIFEFVDQGLADDGLAASTVIAAVTGLAPTQRSYTVGFLSMFMDSIDVQELDALAGNGPDRLQLIAQLHERLPPASLEPPDLQLLLRGAQNESELRSALIGLLRPPLTATDARSLIREMPEPGSSIKVDLMNAVETSTPDAEKVTNSDGATLRALFALSGNDRQRVSAIEKFVAHTSSDTIILGSDAIFALKGISGKNRLQGLRALDRRLADLRMNELLELIANTSEETFALHMLDDKIAPRSLAFEDLLLLLTSEPLKSQRFVSVYLPTWLPKLKADPTPIQAQSLIDLNAPESHEKKLRQNMLNKFLNSK